MEKERRNNWNDFDLSRLIYPVFVKNGNGIEEEVRSMPGVFRYSPDIFEEKALQLYEKGVQKILIFGVPDNKDTQAPEAYSSKSAVSKSIKLIKNSVPGITVFTDICLCAYISHGHCGIIPQGDTVIDNGLTLEALSKMAVAHAAAGADFVAPSAMADAQVSTLRKALDSEGYNGTKIMGYSAKFASNAYGPFRDIADSSPVFGDRSMYQLDFSDKLKAVNKVKRDIDEGADIVMIKPALWYLDIVNEVKTKYKHPLAVYNVSGEYSMVKKGACLGFWDEPKMVFETMSSFARAGADYVITYHAQDIAGWKNEK